MRLICDLMFATYSSLYVCMDMKCHAEFRGDFT
jgi:hypothetical protein